MKATLLSSAPLFDLGPLNQLTDMGGPVMFVLIGMVVIGVTTFAYLILFGAFYAPRLTRKLRQFITQWQTSPNSTDPKTIYLNKGPFKPTNPMVHLLVNSMTAYQNNSHLDAVREIAIRDAQAAIEPFEAPLKIIEVIAALAPLLGLLGTVMGMMEAFSAMAISETQANASQLSGGIYEALTTTAAGLVVAIPFAALAAWVEFRLRRMHKMLDHVLVSIFNVEPQTTSTQDANQAPHIRSIMQGNEKDSHLRKSEDYARSNKQPAHATN